MHFFPLRPLDKFGIQFQRSVTVAVDLVTICFLFNLFRAAKKSNWETEDETFPLKHLEDGILMIFLWPLHLIIIEANATRKMEVKSCL